MTVLCAKCRGRVLLDGDWLTCLLCGASWELPTKEEVRHERAVLEMRAEPKPKPGPKPRVEMARHVTPPPAAPVLIHSRRPPKHTPRSTSKQAVCQGRLRSERSEGDPYLERCRSVKALMGRGLGLSQVAREMRLHPRSVDRMLRDLERMTAMSKGTL